MRFTEKDLEDLIVQTPRQDLIKAGYWPARNGRCFRQVRIGKYGIADLIYIHRRYIPKTEECDFSRHELTVSIVELKKGEITSDAFFQALGYLRGLSNYLEKKYPSKTINYNILLVGSDMNLTKRFKYLFSTFYESTSVLGMIYRINKNGIRFYDIGEHSLINEGF
jgi:hypothetical protein